MIRRFAVGLLLFAFAIPAVADDEKVAWFGSVRDARKAADETGRPLLVAIHRRPIAASPEFEKRLGAWVDRYHDPVVVEQTRAFSCVLRLLPAAVEARPDSDTPLVTHLVLDAKNRVLLRIDGETNTDAFVRFLQRGLRAFGPIAADAPRIDAARVKKRPVQGSSALRPVGIPKGAPGVRVRLRWELPAPDLSGAETEDVMARVLMRWDGAGPWDLGPVSFGPGDDLDLPVEVHFGKLEGLAELATEGKHRLDLYLDPESGSYPFSKGPLHVGRVWIEIGEGGGGGGGGGGDEPDDPEQPEDAPPDQPAPMPEGEDPDPLPPPKEERTEVVDPFVRDGDDTVKKEDAVVAVEDPDAGVKPPKRVPIEEALRDFDKMKERAVGEERLSPRERTFLQRYFEALRRIVVGRAAEGPERAKRVEGGDGK